MEKKSIEDQLKVSLVRSFKQFFLTPGKGTKILPKTLFLGDKIGIILPQTKFIHQK